MASRPSGKMLKSLPPDPARHQDSAITPKKEQIQFIWQLFKGMPPEPMTLAMKPGFRRPGGFVLGDRMLGTAKGRFRSRSQPGVSDQGEIGNRRGSRADWDRDVGKVALKSSSLTFGLCLALACPLPSYVLANSR